VIGYKLTSSDVADVNSRVKTYHRIIEAFKFAFAKRSSLGDEDFVDVKEVRRLLQSCFRPVLVSVNVLKDHQGLIYQGPVLVLERHSSRKFSRTAFVC